ncbi:GGDEF domain-containing protein [Halomonas campisalis]|uniref:diguanylate cyclase n=1 Tax=Billgrantia campisalis TaxID=74661 RepID=A0ABS9P4Z1_9GAMM|nr:GGDEF domain-containing protein [Halomonas campisalis]MCG6656317.1 GGDEF domain-containing protein [Halomonas campisalis]MDR5861503.1 GGDEF domain-containing protein [Halomonas campisalis]
MSERQHLALRWQLALGFTLLAGVCALAIGLYVANARQHVGANYTALVADVVRAQQHPVLLRDALDRLHEPSPQAHQERLDNLLWRIPQHIEGVTHGLERSQLDPADYTAPLDRLRGVKEQLPELQRRVDEMLAGVPPDELRRLGYLIENDLARAYSELNELIHTAAGEQRLIMERLTLAIGVLVLLSLLVVGALMLALLRLNHQRAAVARLSQMDELTRLGNRRHLLEAAEVLHQQSRRNGQPLSLALLDLDHFKRLNDTYGHPAGDRVLVRFAEALREETRQADVIARMGGEEFCVLMPDTPASGALELAERIRKRIAALSHQELGIPTSISVSLGVATGDGESSNFDSLYSRADHALYLAKANGRNCTQVG